MECKSILLQTLSATKVITNNPFSPKFIWEGDFFQFRKLQQRGKKGTIW